MKYRYRNEEEMKDSGIEWIGRIPKNWSISRIDKEFIVRNEKVSDKDFSPLSVTKQGILPQLENVAKSDNNDNRKKVLKGDFVINSRADRKGSCGVSTYDGSVSLICNVLTPKYLESQYVHSLFRNYYFSEEFYRWGSGIVDDLWSTNIEKMKKINIPIPNENEDKKIANFLEKKTTEFDSIISKKEALIQKLEEVKKSLISEIVTGKVKVVKTSDGYKLIERKKEEMKDSGVEWLGKIPSYWKRIKVSRIANVVRGASPRPAGDPNYFGGNDVPWITVAEVTKDENKLLDSVSAYLTSLGKIQSRYLEEGTLIMSNSGATLGVPKILNISGCINDGSLAFLNLDIDKNYLYYLLKSRTKIFREEMQISGQPNLNTDVVKSLDILKPLEEEQRIIAEYLDCEIDQINVLIEKSNYQIGKLKEAKQSLISEAVTGKIEILD
ncbi:restriction endonuclease subunit S [Haloimpatiens sp. FM7330]|uniref:restriction endonuclease subunit S n=1 Tax=Haloimpatiens sp. FM7330 TaxID=3298610 RepID=UPI003635BB5B